MQTKRAFLEHQDAKFRNEDSIKNHVRPDYFTVVWMIVVHILGVLAFFNFSWSGVLVAAILYFVTGCLGITFCFHRLLSHRSFKAHPVVEGITAICGTLALQGTVQEWVAHHRLHHQGSDTARDPHNARKGFWFSHWGWIFIHQNALQNKNIMARNTRDIMSNRFLAILARHDVMILFQVLLGLGLWAIGGFSWVLWGVFFRLLAVYHTTWFVNSATHRWGYKNFPSDDLAVNTWWVALLTWGEGWHNNHHKYSSVCPAGFRWWELDITYGIVCLLEAVHLVTHVRRFPSKAYEDQSVFIRNLKISRVKRSETHHTVSGQSVKLSSLR